MIMERYFGRSLKARIAIVASLLFIGGVGLIAALVAHILHGDMHAMLSKQQLAASGFIARDIDAKVVLRIESLKRVVQNMPATLFDHPAKLQSWLEDRKAIHTLFPIGLMVIPPDGGPTLADTPRLESRPKSFVDRDWFMGAKRTGAPYISKPLIARATQEPAVVIAIPVFDEHKRLRGIVAGVTPLLSPGFLDLILGNSPGKNGRYQLVSQRDQLFVVATDILQATAELPDKGEDPILDSVLAGQRSQDVIHNAAQQPELVTVNEIPSSNWLLISRQPTEDAFQPAKNTLRNTVLISVLVALPVIALMLAALNRLLAPLSQLSKELHAMADGTRPMHPLPMQTTEEISDVTESFNRLQHKLNEQEQRLAEMVRHDILTGLPNRRLIEERMDRELQRIQRSQSGMALLFLDIDGFKPVNDAFGHQTGDRVLIEIARRLCDTVRDIDTVARLGGDEFLILLTDTPQPLEAAKRVALQCIEVLSEPIRIDDIEVRIGVSIGITTCAPHEAASMSTWRLVNQADAAMYQAKAAGRNCYAIQDPTDSPSHS